MTFSARRGRSAACSLSSSTSSPTASIVPVTTAPVRSVRSTTERSRLSPAGRSPDRTCGPCAVPPARGESPVTAVTAGKRHQHRPRRPAGRPPTAREQEPPVAHVGDATSHPGAAAQRDGHDVLAGSGQPLVEPHQGALPPGPVGHLGIQLAPRLGVPLRGQVRRTGRPSASRPLLRPRRCRPWAKSPHAVRPGVDDSSAARACRRQAHAVTFQSHVNTSKRRRWGNHESNRSDRPRAPRQRSRRSAPSRRCSASLSRPVAGGPAPRARRASPRRSRSWSSRSPRRLGAWLLPEHGGRPAGAPAWATRATGRAVGQRMGPAVCRRVAAVLVGAAVGGALAPGTALGDGPAAPSPGFTARLRRPAPLARRRGFSGHLCDTRRPRVHHHPGGADPALDTESGTTACRHRPCHHRPAMTPGTSDSRPGLDPVPAGHATPPAPVWSPAASAPDRAADVVVHRGDTLVGHRAPPPRPGRLRRRGRQRLARLARSQPRGHRRRPRPDPAGPGPAATRVLTSTPLARPGVRCRPAVRWRAMSPPGLHQADTQAPRRLPASRRCASSPHHAPVRRSCPRPSRGCPTRRTAPLRPGRARRRLRHASPTNSSSASAPPAATTCPIPGRGPATSPRGSWR